MSFSFCFRFSWMKWPCWLNLRFYLSVSGVNQVEWGREMSDFLLLAQRIESFPSDPPQAGWHNLVRVYGVCRWLSQLWLVFVLLGLMLPWVMHVGFENTCTVSGKWNIPRIILRFCGRVYKTLRLFQLAVEHSLVVITVGAQSRQSQI